MNGCALFLQNSVAFFLRCLSPRLLVRGIGFELTKFLGNKISQIPKIPKITESLKDKLTYNYIKMIL